MKEGYATYKKTKNQKKKIKKKKKKRKKLRQYMAHKQSKDNFIKTVCLKASRFSSRRHLLPPFSSNLNLEFRQNFKRHSHRLQLKFAPEVWRLGFSCP
jgi:hypothetical protein